MFVTVTADMDTMHAALYTMHYDIVFTRKRPNQAARL